MSSQLGEAFVPIRATLDKLDGDLKQARSKIESAMSTITGSVQKIGGLALTGAAAGILGIGAAAGATAISTINMAADFQNATAAIITGTGAAGEALAEMEGIAKSLAGSSAGLGRDFGELGAVIAEVNTRTGATGEALEEFSADVLNLSRLTGGDAVKNTQLITRVMGDWDVAMEDSGQLLDMLFGAGQAFGISVDDLSAKVVQFGAPLRQMGFSLEESVALFGKWEKEGVNAELAIGSLRIAAGHFAKEQGEVNETVVGGVKSMAEAEQKLDKLKKQLDLTILKQGEWTDKTKESTKVQSQMKIEDLTRQIAELEAAMAQGEFRTITTAKEQKTLQENLLETFEAIKNNEDATAALALGMEVFGARAGPDMVAAIREGRFELEDALQALQATSGGLDDAAERSLTLGERWQITKSKVMTALMPLGTIVLDLAGRALPVLDSVLNERVIPAIELSAEVVERLVGNLQDGMDPVEAIGLAIEELIGSEAAAWFADMVAQVREFADAAQEMAQPVVDMATEFVSWKDILIALGIAIAAVVLPALYGIVTAAAPVIATGLALIAIISLARNAWENDWGGIRSAVAGTIDYLEPYWERLKEALNEFWQEVVPALQEVWQTLVEVWQSELQPALSDLWAALQDLFEALGFGVEDTDYLSAALGLLKIALALVLFYVEMLSPTIKFFADRIKNSIDQVKMLVEFLTSMKRAVDAAVEPFKRLAGKIGDLIEKATGLPDWLIPGSPTPFERGLRGIGQAINAMPDLEFDIPALGSGEALAAAATGGPIGPVEIRIDGAQEPQAVARAVRAELERLFGQARR